jgi:photosystem II stability/assembly factor-like uncharacterized protein
MKTPTFRKKVFLMLITVISLFSAIPIFAQAGDQPITASKWFYSPRAYPFDTLPNGALENAFEQREDLLLNTSYQFASPVQWESIGPTPFGSGLISSGRIHHVVYDPRDPNNDGRYIYVTGAAGGVWKTTNGGTNWQNKSGDLPSLLAGAFTIDADNDILYFGTTGTFNTWLGAGNGMRLFKSTNDGDNWLSISDGLEPGSSIFKIVISPNDVTGNTLFAATNRGLYKTTNGGDLWTKIIPEDDAFLICSDVCFSPDGNVVYAIGPTAGRSYPWDLIFDGIGFWRSDDGGDNFAPVSQSSGFPHTANILTERTLCAVSKAAGADSLVWFITFDNLDVNVDVYKSTDYGQNFTSSVVGTNGETRFQLVLRASDDDADICFAGSQNLYMTTDGGSTWPFVDGYGGQTHPDFLALDFNPFDPNKITSGNDGGVYRSDNLGANWTSCNQDLGGFTLLWGLASSTYDESFVAGGLHDFGYGYNSTAGPSSEYWVSINYGADGGNMSASPFKSKHFVANKVYGSEFHFSNNGTGFGGSSGYGYGTTEGVSAAPFMHHPTQPGVVYTVRFTPQWLGTMQVHFRKSTDYGASWGGDNTPFREFQRPNAWSATAPSSISISQSNPNIMIMAFTNGHEFWQSQYDAKSRLIKSTDAGVTWEGIDGSTAPIVVGGAGGTPNRAFTDIEIDPNNPNLQYLSVSGYYYPSTNQGHVFKSTNGGYNWTDISGDLPDIPVNDIMIHYTGTGSNDKELIIATDAGIYVTNAVNIAWEELAAGFPNAPAFHLDYNRLSGKLRANTWGRGAWEFQLDDGTIYVQDRLYITDNVTLNNDIVVSPGGKLIMGLSAANSSMTVTFNNGADITVENGGTILANSNIPITLTSSSSWAGIEVKGNSSNCVLKNVTFNNTTTPLVINEGLSAGIPTPVEGILIYDCHFINVPIEVIGRSDVSIKYCDWAMSTGTDAIIASGADGIYLEYNDIVYSTQVDNSSPIQLSLCDDATITRSTITGADYPITVSYGTTYIRYSDITTSDADESYTGIYLANVGDGHLMANDVSGYQVGYHLLSSSPNLFINNADGSNSNGNKTAIEFIGSSPVMFPTVTEEAVIWDGGLNTLRNDASGGFGMYNSEGEPQLDYGYNTIVGETNIEGDYPQSEWDVHCNSWEHDPPVFNVSGVTMNYSPTDCTPPDSRPVTPVGGKSGSEKGGNVLENWEVIPPQPLVVNYGNGLIDTLEVSSGSIDVTADIHLFGSGTKEMYLGNFEEALGIFEDVVTTYQDSAVAISSLNRIFYCHNRMHSDSAAYNTLRAYFLNLASTHNTDTTFSRTAAELSRKCLVKQKNYVAAISEYEDVVENSTDSSEIQIAEISIIELYIILNSVEGDAMGFTGRLAHLKPSGLRDGMNKIREKMGREKSQSTNVNIPKQFSLSQNYPNPFNPLTKINYAIPNTTKVTLKIYDVLGKLVKTLVNETKDAGVYNVTFDGSTLASGIYFYKIEAGDFVESKKMVLVK